MSNKLSPGEAWKAPSPEEIKRVIKSLGGTNAVCSITKKHRNTIARWCHGKMKIDYANWKLISEINKK